MGDFIQPSLPHVAFPKKPNVIKARGGNKAPQSMRLLSPSGIIAVILYFAVSVISRTCYMTDQLTVAPDDVPCNPDTNTTTTCCNKKDICMTNGLCYVLQDKAMTLSRGSCTDRSWGYPCSDARPCGMRSFPPMLFRVLSRT